jgi:hypothetical protein
LVEFINWLKKNSVLNLRQRHNFLHKHKILDRRWVTGVGEGADAADSVAARVSEDVQVKALGMVLRRFLKWDKGLTYLHSAGKSLSAGKTLG